MKKLIATIALGTFVFTSTLVTTSFAADNETAETVKASTTAENTAETTAISAAATGAEELVVPAIIFGVGVGAAAIIAADDNDAGHSGHSGHSGH